MKDIIYISIIPFPHINLNSIYKAVGGDTPKGGYMFSINKEFFNRLAYLKHTHIIILRYALSWIMSDNPPKSKKFDDDERKYYWFSYDKIQEDLVLSRAQVQNAFFRLENKDKKVKEYLTEPFVYPKQDKKHNRLYLAFNFDLLNELFQFNSSLKLKKDVKDVKLKEVKSKKKQKKEEVNNMIFSEHKKGYSDEAEAITRKFISKNNDVFHHKLPKENEKPTKLFIQICKKIQDIYDGKFLNSDDYSLSEGFLTSKQFDISGYMNVLQSVAGDWTKVKKLLYTSVSNFKLMREKDRMPFNKKYLQNNLSLWLYDDSFIGGQSQFVQSFKEPKKTVTALSEKKADKILDKMSENVRFGAKALYKLAPSNTPAGKFFENVQKMAEWAKLAAKYDDNFYFWTDSSSNIPYLFAKYCYSNGISVNTSLIDVEKALTSNTPFSWFVRDAISRHGLNKKLSASITEPQFKENYRLRFTLDDDDAYFNVLRNGFGDDEEYFDMIRGYSAR